MNEIIGNEMRFPSSDDPFFTPRQMRELRRKERRDAFLVALRIIETHGEAEAANQIRELASQLEYTQ